MADISKVQFFRDTTPLACRRCPYLKEHWIADGHPTVRCSSIGKRYSYDFTEWQYCRPLLEHRQAGQQGMPGI